MKSYIYRVTLVREEDGRWSALVPALPGCAVWGYTPEEAIEAVKEAAQAYIEVLVEDGRSVPLEEADTVIEGAAVAVVA